MNKNLWVVIGLVLLTFGYFHEYFLFGQDAHVRVHDNLDSDVVYRHHLAKEGMIFAGPMEPVESVMDGLPRVCLPSGLNIMVWLYGIFGTFGGMVVSELLVHALAYLGMLLLLKTHFLRDDKYFWTRHLMALFFATMAYFPVSGGAVVLQPFLLNAMLNIRASNKIRLPDLLAIAAFPLYSSFVWVGLFVVILLGGMWVQAVITKGLAQTKAFFAAVVLLVVLSVVADHQLFLMFFFPSKFFVHHRTEFQIVHDYNYKGVVIMGVYNAFAGIYHSASYMGIAFFVAPLMAFGMKFLAKEKAIDLKPVWIAGGVLVFVGFMTTFWFWDQLDFIYQKGSFFNQINFSRFHYLLPVSGMVLLACSVAAFHSVPALRYSLLVLLVASSAYNYKLYHDLHHKMPGDHMSDTSFREFFAEDLFQQVKSDLDLAMKGQDYRVVCLGLEPSALQYNGFKTLDSYQNLYPVEYKHKFHKIIAPELAKCPDLTTAYVSGSNNQCYLYSCELQARKVQNLTGRVKSIDEMLLDPDALLALNGHFIVSRIKIGNFGTERIKEWKQYMNPNRSVYQEIYIYQVL